MDSDSARRARASRRAHWPVKRHGLTESTTDDLSQETTVEQRIAMVWRLTLDAWASMGTPLPTYSRAETPTKMVRRVRTSA